MSTSDNRSSFLNQRQAGAGVSDVSSLQGLGKTSSTELISAVADFTRLAAGLNSNAPDAGLRQSFHS